jgi:hypothetical protein
LSELSVAALYEFDPFWGQLFGPINDRLDSKNAKLGWSFILKKLSHKAPRPGKFDRIKRPARHIACLSRDSIGRVCIGTHRGRANGRASAR